MHQAVCRLINHQWGGCVLEGGLYFPFWLTLPSTSLLSCPLSQLPVQTLLSPLHQGRRFQGFCIDISWFPGVAKSGKLTSWKIWLCSVFLNNSNIWLKVYEPCIHCLVLDFIYPDETGHNMQWNVLYCMCVFVCEAIDLSLYLPQRATPQPRPRLNI